MHRPERARDLADKMLSALRYQFGGHREKAATKEVVA